MLERLEKHHLGFIVPVSSKKSIEEHTGKKFIFDSIQKCHVLFEYQPILKIYFEYICQEGRALKQDIGFAHICYNVKNLLQLEEIESLIKKDKLGFKVTQLEKSGSEECGHVVFFFLKKFGLVEFNLPE
jgi:hypothetical protein